MARYFIKLSYCGTAYNGWQKQPHKNTSTVQGTLEDSLFTYLRSKIELTGCGRTDTGVHAMDYYAHFDFQTLEDVKSIIFRLNKILPSDISIQDIISMHDDAHARFDAVSRSYQYHLHTFKSPFADRSFYYHYGVPDLDMLNEAAALILKYVDFTTFCKANTDVNTMFCKITESYWEQHGEHYVYKVTADRFLRGMIRLIVGMCLQVARKKLTLTDVAQALESKQRLNLDWSVPAIGLTLYDIKYPYLESTKIHKTN